MSIKITNFKEIYLNKVNLLISSLFDINKIPYSIDTDFLKRRIINNSHLFATDCSKVLLLNDEVCGIAVANFNQNPKMENGDFIYLNLFGIAPGHRKRGLGKQLLNTLLKEAKDNHKQGITTSLQWAGVWPGIFSHCKDMFEFCSHTGGKLTQGELFAEVYIQELNDIDISINNNSITIRACTQKDFINLKQFLDNYYSIGWLHETLNKIDKSYDPFNGYGISTPYYPEDLFVIAYQKDILGFCVTQSNTNQNLGFLGPIAIDKQLRGQGIGRGLLLTACQYLASRDKTKVGLWTNEAIYNKFYRSFGFRRTFETANVTWLL